MDTKLKTIRYTVFFKTFLILVTLVGMLLFGYGLLFYEQFEVALSSSSYRESETSLRSYRQTFSLLDELLTVYRNETYIEKGMTLTDDRVANARLEIVSGQKIEMDALDEAYDNCIYEATQVNNLDELKRLETEKAERSDRMTAVTETLLHDVESVLIQKELQKYKELKTKLSKMDGFVYSVNNGVGDSLENIGSQNDVKAYFEQLPSAMMINDGEVIQLGTNVSNNWIEPNRLDGYVGQLGNSFVSKEADFLYTRENGRYALAGIAAGLFLVIISVGYFISVVGRSNKESGVILTFWDKPYLDLATVVIVGIIAALMGAILYLGEAIYPNDYYGFIYIAGSIVILGTLVGYYWLRLVVKRIKRKEVFQRTFCFQILKFFFGATFNRLKLVNESIQKGSVSRRLVYEGAIYTIALGLAFLTIPLFVSVFGVLGLFMSLAIFVAISLYAFQYRYNRIASLAEIKAGVGQLATGHLDHRINTKGFDPENKAFAEAIHNIADGYLISVENEVKAERMKAELVTNVSHDLKTPLTSLIAYVDLLKMEELGSEQAKIYLAVVDQKVERLRTLIEDLFEAAKASSGTLQVQLEAVDFAELLTQGLGEISEQITASGLDFRIQIAEKPLYVLSDGKLLWRVVENLVSNVLKYSLQQSRVYVQLSVAGDDVQLIIKNISSHELNLPAYELTERFKRGDEARHSEGSGLGLSIAKSLTELMHGKFLIEVDGDLFKAIVSFKRVAAPVVAEEIVTREEIVTSEEIVTNEEIVNSEE